jgi:hypothetical protein
MHSQLLYSHKPIQNDLILTWRLKMNIICLGSNILIRHIHVTQIPVAAAELGIVECFWGFLVGNT